MQSDMPLSTRQGLAYGAMGLPLAFVALPLYVILPNHYATAFGMPLATLGLVLLGARLLDAVIDPFIGRWCDRLFARSPRQILWMAAVAALVLAAGFGLLFFPATREPQLLLVWASVFLVITYAAYSALSVAHQSWGAMLGGDELQRSRIVAWREGLALVGVVLASVAPVAIGLPGTWILFSICLVMGWFAWSRALRPVALASLQRHNIWRPLQQPRFRRLLGIFVLNGIASAIPATLVLFFVQDRLQASRALEPVFLGTYFVCAAASMPLWLQLVRRIGLTRSWLCGTDLALPGAMLAGLIANAGHRGHLEGAYFGWWNFATKLNLALAAGLALPLLALFGYAPGARDAGALTALTMAYCLLPCLLKLAAATLLFQYHRQTASTGAAV
jgi:glycoside/pentoside/hexuronide:cation symporter, GPH family